MTEKPMKVYRHYDGSKQVPMIKMSGQWLQDFGFEAGCRIAVSCCEGSLSIRIIASAQKVWEEEHSLANIAEMDPACLTKLRKVMKLYGASKNMFVGENRKHETFMMTVYPKKIVVETAESPFLVRETIYHYDGSTEEILKDNTR